MAGGDSMCSSPMLKAGGTTVTTPWACGPVNPAEPCEPVLRGCTAIALEELRRGEKQADNSKAEKALSWKRVEMLVQEC